MEVTDTQKPTSTESAVWAVYDECRTARLNVKYHQCEVARLNSWNKRMEILIAVATSSSVGGFTFWQSAWGGYVWKIVGLVAVLASIVKPILKLQETAARKAKILAGYKLLDHDLNVICIEIRQRKVYDTELHCAFRVALQKKSELVKEDCDSPISKAIQSKCEQEVIREMPEDRFYIPKE